MSLSLDVTLFLRNSKTKLGLSTAARFILMVLSFRIGSNQATWIKPEALSAETGIHKTRIYPHIAALIKSGLIKKTPDKKNKRKHFYSVHSAIKNYSQMNDEQKKNAHFLLKDEYDYPVDNSETQSRKRESKSTFQSRKRESKSTFQSRKRESKLQDNTDKSPVLSTFQEDEILPKVTVKQTSIKSKVTAGETVTSGTHEKSQAEERWLRDIENWYPSEECQSLADQMAIRCKTTGMKYLEGFREFNKRQQPSRRTLDELFKRYSSIEKRGQRRMENR